MLYHRERGYGLDHDSENSWSFRSAFKALGFEVGDLDLKRYRDYFIKHGFGKFDGRDDPGFRISPHEEEVARVSIARRKSWYSLRRLQTYNWNFWGAMAAILAAIFSLAALFKV